ncbi:hypothetical protein B7P43_G11558 [Cryptotermes secundus]|uniref:Endonuclease/exonuclease/phosphatase domain-containing protein n=1 Tax=Cryptotermes secundus TaxID=105785 RepID=A0A2J7RRH6_9NEOP|nr:hypothetical protein B7P43_G11558 [Cryptotermes secundus]
MSCRRYNKKKCEDQKEHHGYKIGTCNVRTLNQAGKLENFKTEMHKNEVSVLSVSEVQWKGQGEIRSGDYTVYYSGGERAERGVAIVVHESVVRSVVKKIVCNGRIIALNLKAEPVDILIEKVYDKIEEILQEDGRGDTNCIILGEWNSTVGDEPYQNIVGSHGLGRRNHRGQMLIDFCERNGLIVTNTWFKKPKRRIYTWKAPGDWKRHQQDYILVKHRFRNSVKDVKTLPGADIDSDHNLLVAKFQTRLKKIIIFRKRRPRLDLEKLYAQRQSVQEILEEKLGAIEGESGNAEVQWNNIK